MRFTIERMRTLVLATGVVLVLALAAFLAVGRWKNVLNGRDLPKRLAQNVLQEASGVTYAEAHGGHMLFKIHASRAEQLNNDHELLHNVQIEFFGKDGNGVDSISGSNFEYDTKSGVGTAQGPVDIKLTRPPVAAASGTKPPEGPTAAGALHVKTSGLSFNKNTGVLTTAKKVNFTMESGNGTAIGAKYDSQRGFLVLDHAVQLTTTHGGKKVVVQAEHAELERNAQVCRLTNATIDFKGGQARGGWAKILFRKDGSAQRLDAADGFTLVTTDGGQLSSPVGFLLFGAHNLPRNGEMSGGVKLTSEGAGRQLLGSAPSAEMQFGAQGRLKQVAMSQGVEMRSETENGSGAKALRVSRTWRSPVAQMDFRDAGNGRIQPAELHGSGGVVVTTETQRGNATPLPARLTADQVTGQFGPAAQLTAIQGVGHAEMEQTAANGAREKATGDRIDARLAPAVEAAKKTPGAKNTAAEIQSAVLDGNVVLVEHPAQKAGAQAQSTMRATAGHATYAGADQRLELTENPRLDDGGLELSAKIIDVFEQAGEGFAHGDVKATWLETDAATGQDNKTSAPTAEPAGAKPAGLALGGQAPAHVVADEAHFMQAGGQAEFRGHARLWQEANSIAAPVIVLNRARQTVVARSTRQDTPVEAVLLARNEAATEMAPGAQTQKKPKEKSHSPSVIRVRGGEFTYSDAEHRAVMTTGALGPVVAEAGGATCTAHQVVLLLGPRSANNSATEVERVTASGDVVVISQGRRGDGAKLVYSGLTGDYALTGTPAKPPRLNDPSRGTVTGAALIFNSRNDSVSIEGRGHETRTETTAPRR